MTSSIYPRLVSIDFVGFVDTLTIIIAGTGYPDVPVVTIAAPSGTTATATSTIASNGTLSSITVTNEGAGYPLVPNVTIDAPVSGTTATATANLSNGKIVSITITNAGSGYTTAPSVTIAAPSGTTATATATASGGIIQTVTITDPGSGYTSIPTVSIADGNADAQIDATIASLTSSTDILTSDIEITSDMVKPGGGGILRVYFSLEFDSDTPSTIGVFDDGTLKGNFNADNSSLVDDGGYYRFDIDVEAGNKINFQSSVAIDSVNFFRTHLVQFGA